MSADASAALTILPERAYAAIEATMDQLCPTRPVSAMCRYQRRTTTGARLVEVVGIPVVGVRQANLRTGPDPHGIASPVSSTRFEAVVNVALAPYPLSSVCAYDTRMLPEAALAAARATHPNLPTATGHQRNDHYQDPASYLRRWVAAAPDPLQATVPIFTSGELVDSTQLASLRTELRPMLARAGSPGARSWSDLVTAVGEVAANGIVHGRPPVLVRVWATGERLLASHRPGRRRRRPLAGYVPARGADPRRVGMGLWLARQLCDQLEMARSPYGFTSG